MRAAELASRATAMPLMSPSYPPGPYRFIDREFVVITYRTDMERLRDVVPEPLGVPEPLVNYEFIRMPDSTGFGDYTESGQVIPVTFRGKPGAYVHAMYLDDHAPIAGGREIWGFPKKLATPKLTHEGDVIVGTLHSGSTLCATASMGYKHKILDPTSVARGLAEPGFLLKIIPDVDGTLRICELVRYFMEDVQVKAAWSAPAALELQSHVTCDVARLPVREVVSAVHYVADLTLGLGEVVHDYLGRR